ncbi:MAG: glycosyltransferase [Cytophagales bacterium]|nr:glycosyltransferase [Cytophagales bacterium]
MRVLHVNSELSWRGGERQVELLTNYGAKDVDSIIACDQRGQLNRHLEGTHEVVDLSIKNGFDFKAALRLKKLARQADLIHCHTPKAQSIAILAKLLGCNRPVICTKRTSFPIGSNFFSKFKYRKTDQVVCVSQASANVLQKQLPDINIKVIHSAIEKPEPVVPIELDQLIPETRDRKVIGYVAAVTEEKNPEVFLETARAVLAKYKNCCFLWIGDGELKETVQAQINLLGLSSRVFLPGFQANIQSWITALDVLFFPSLSEGFPTTLLQAMQVGVPVIASDLPSIREIVTDGETGLLSDAKNEEEFTHKIMEVVSNDDLRNKLKANALDSVTHFYVEEMVQKYVKLYGKL